MTFIGFCANNNGDLIDPASRKVIHERLFTRELLRGLKMQQVTFTDDGSNNQLVHAHCSLFHIYFIGKNYCSNCLWLWELTLKYFIDILIVHMC